MYSPLICSTTYLTQWPRHLVICILDKFFFSSSQSMPWQQIIFQKHSWPKSIRCFQDEAPQSKNVPIFYTMKCRCSTVRHVNSSKKAIVESSVGVRFRLKSLERMTEKSKWSMTNNHVSVTRQSSPMIMQPKSRYPTYTLLEEKNTKRCHWKGKNRREVLVDFTRPQNGLLAYQNKKKTTYAKLTLASKLFS